MVETGYGVSDCTGWIEPLDLQCILVNHLAGSMELFLVIMILFIAGISAYFKMIDMVTLIMFGFFAITLALYLQGIYLLVTLIAAFFVAYSIGRVVKA